MRRRSNRAPPIIQLLPEAQPAEGARRRFIPTRFSGIEAPSASRPSKLSGFFLSVSPPTTTKHLPRFTFITKRVGHRVWRLEPPRTIRFEPTTCDLRVDTASALVATGETSREVLLGLVARTGDRERAPSLSNSQPLEASILRLSATGDCRCLGFSVFSLAFGTLSRQQGACCICRPHRSFSALRLKIRNDC